MRRRDAVHGPLALSVATHARIQVPGRIYRVGYLGYASTNTPDDARVWRGFVQLLKAAVPVASRIAFARSPRGALIGGLGAVDVSALQVERQRAARSLGIGLLTLDVDEVADFDSATAALRVERPDALLLGATQVNFALCYRWLAFVARQRRSMMALAREFGALSCYGPDSLAVFRKAAEYVARILGGACQGELPMEQPTEFELVVNRSTARQIGLRLPQSLLLRADEVIQ